MRRTIIQTADGSKTVAIENERETYHSRHGAVQESKHVFITNGVAALAKGRQSIRILEVGFGTGLNALLTYRFAIRQRTEVDYLGLEPHPLTVAERRALDYATNEELALFEAMHEVGELPQAIAPTFTLRRAQKGLLEAVLPESSIDLIYYDAFGPKTQPELWTLACFERCLSALTAGGALVTYCAKGQVRRDLLSVGFEVERLPGPPGKREMLRAWKR